MPPPRSRLLLELKKLPKQPTMTQQLKVNRMRTRLGKQIRDFIRASSSFLPSLKEVNLKAVHYESINTPAEEFVEPEELTDGSWEGEIVSQEEGGVELF